MVRSVIRSIKTFATFNTSQHEDSLLDVQATAAADRAHAFCTAARLHANARRLRARSVAHRTADVAMSLTSGTYKALVGAPQVWP